MNKDKIDFQRGEEDIAFIETGLDMKEISDKDQPRKVLEDRMEEKGLEWKNARILGLFKQEFSLMLEEDAEISLNGQIIKRH